MQHIAVLRAVQQRMVHQHQGQHRLRNRRRANSHAGIVPAVCLDDGRRAVPSDRAPWAAGCWTSASARSTPRCPVRSICRRACRRHGCWQSRPAAFRRRALNLFAARLANPAPISTPLTALIPIIACAMSASSFAARSAPQPDRHAGRPPHATARRPSRRFCAAHPLVLKLSHHPRIRRKKRVRLDLGPASRTESDCRRVAACSHASQCRTSRAATFSRRRRAATIGAVRRADERPPPRGSRTPYLRQ